MYSRFRRQPAAYANLQKNPSDKKFLKKLKDKIQLIRGGLFDETHGGHGGFRKEERVGFENILHATGLVDVYREKNPVDHTKWG